MSDQQKTFDSLDARTREWLEEVGITGASELRVLGPRTVYEMIRELHPEAPPNVLGRLQDVARARRRR